MEKKGKIIIGIAVVILALIIAGVLFLNSMDVTLLAGDSQITLPNNYSIDDKGVASCGDINVLYTAVSGGSPENELQFQKAIVSNGKEAGYENITNKTINGYTVYDYAGHPDKLKNVSTDKEYSSDGSSSWSTFSPYFAYDGVTSLDVDHYRMLSFVKGDKISYLTFFTDNPDASLYTPEIENAINSIADVEK